MHNSNIENTIKKSNWISIGFVSVVIIIASIGITAWISLNKLFNAVERYDGASQFLLALDKAHLQELSYTRNLTESAASEAMRSLDEAIVLVKGMESSSANYNEATKSIERQLVRYQSNFKAYVNLRREDEQAKRIMLVQAQQASKLVDEFLSLQTDYINTDTQLVGKLYFELSENSRLTTSIRSLLSSVYLIREYAKYEIFNQANVIENQLSILTSIFEEISDLETNNNDEIILNNLHQVRGLSNAYQYTLLELSDEQQGEIDLEKASREELDYLASKMLNLSEILQKRQKLRYDISQKKLEAVKNQLSRRMEISKAVMGIERRLNESRKLKHDFLLTANKENSETYTENVLVILNEIISDIDELEKRPIDNDQKELISKLTPFIKQYKSKIKKINLISNDVRKTSKDMISEAVTIDSNLSMIRDVRFQEMADARKLAGYLPLGGVIFLVSVALLGYLTRKSSKELQEITNILQISNDKAVKVADAKSEFLAMMSHEIRTPMNAILGMSYLALQSNMGSNEKNYIYKVHSSATLLLGIINDILDFSKIEAGKVKIEAIEFNFEEMLERFKSLILNKATENNVDFSIMMQNTTPKNLIGDPLRIHQILMNLASNAIKFSENGKVKIRLEFVNKAEDIVWVYISVKDDGIGMSEDQLTNLYTSFTQADSSTTRKFGGTGLGLTITKKLVDLMNGNISVESTLGVGTEFCVTLPLKTNKKLSIEDSVKIKNRTLLIIHDESKLGNVIRDNNSNIASDIVETNAEAYLKNPNDFSSLDIVFYIPETRLSKEKLVRVYNSFMTTNSSVFILSIDNDDNIYSLVDNVSCETNIKVSKKELTIEYISDLITRNGTPSKEVMIYNENNSNLSRMKPCFVGAHILLAEDNEINQEIVHEILTRLKIKVTIVENGKEAISALRSANNFDLVLMDCQMPEIDGYQATKIIREDPSIDRIPILALTANVLQSDSKKALDSGMDAVIHKPIVISDLINTLSKWLGYDLDSLCNHVLKKVELEGSEQLQALSQLEGVDIENGLMISNGNYELYEKLLQSFSKQFANFEIRFVDKEQAARNVHTLKGASGNLGFTQVQEICLALETALRTRNTQEIDELSKLLTLKINELQSVIDEIFLPRKIKIKSFLDLQKLKNDILPLLNSYDVMGIVKIDNDYRSAIVEQLSPQDRLSFNRAMKTYNFEEIIHLIKSLDSIKE